MPQLGHEISVSEDIGIRKPLTDIGQNTQPASKKRHRQNDRSSVGKRVRNRFNQRINLRVA